MKEEIYRELPDLSLELYSQSKHQLSCEREKKKS